MTASIYRCAGDPRTVDAACAAAASVERAVAGLGSDSDACGQGGGA
ncbi:MAG: hypothetical protein IPL61_09035 [Myxococcales bacterium]|nr:hypothetical protein [Myxococcales bacterium]